MSRQRNYRMLAFILAFVASLLCRVLGVLTSLIASYKTEVLFTLGVGLSLSFAGTLFDRSLVVITLLAAFFEGYKIGEHPLV